MYASEMGYAMEQIELLDVVALTVDLPTVGLRRGQVGTVVERYSDDAFEVEFVDRAGITYAMLALERSQLLALHYVPLAA